MSVPSANRVIQFRGQPGWELLFRVVWPQIIMEEHGAIAVTDALYECGVRAGANNPYTMIREGLTALEARFSERERREG